MTNSHNRSLNGRNGERYMNHSTQHSKVAGSGNNTQMSGRKNISGTTGGRSNKSPSANSPNSSIYSSSSKSSSMLITTDVPSTTVTANASPAINILSNSSNINYMKGQHSRTDNQYNNITINNSINNSRNTIYNYHPQRSSPHGGNASSPPNFSYFAGSKCFDAPAPNALPLPPSHWTQTCAAAVEAAKFNNYNDHFSNNLKLLLNVKA